MTDKKEDECKAPVFKRNPGIICLLMYIAFPVIFLACLLGDLFNKPKCCIKKYVYRLKNCTKGNSDPHVIDE